MVPSKTKSNKTFPAHQTSLKQGTLGFTSSKRTASSASAKGKDTSAPAFKKRKSSADSTPTPLSQDELTDRVEQGKKKCTAISPKSSAFQSREGLENIQGNDKAEMESLDSQDKSGKWRNHYYAVKGKMGHLKPIHAEAQTKVHLILRVFDLSAEYGPCVGVTRMERWERACALGLNPPIEVHDILSTREGQEDDQYSQCVFHDQV